MSDHLLTCLIETDSKIIPENSLWNKLMLSRDSSLCLMCRMDRVSCTGKIEQLVEAKPTSKECKAKGAYHRRAPLVQEKDQAGHEEQVEQQI
ncbi:hypothetical protein Tco_0438304 [Tanacetum coccineum]